MLRLPLWLTVCALLSAAAVPCPPAEADASRPALLGAPAHAAHADHGEPTSDSEESAAAEASGPAALRATCLCGCGKRTAPLPGSRLGPALLPKAAEAAPEPGAWLRPRAAIAPLRAAEVEGIDPVPRRR